jgi:aspartate aminotransferase
MAITALAAELTRSGKDVIALGAGEPDFDTPAHIKAAAIAAIQAGDTKYTAVDGTRGLKTAISAKFERDNGLAYGADQILVTSGAKQTCYNVCQALLNDGDEVVIPAPYWVSYPDMVKLAGANPIVVTTTADQHYKLSPQQLDAAVTERTRLFILNSPSNPTGMAYTRAELVALGEVLAKYPNVIVAVDDIYELIYWGKEPFCSLATACPDLYGRTITINGVSKCYAMTGWRIGYAGGPVELIAAMKKIQSQSTSNACTISQAAATAALDGDQTCVAEMCRAFKQRHDYVVDALNHIPGFHCRPGDGTFYAFPNVTQAIANKSLKDDTELTALLLEEAEVAVVPGTAFGAPGHVRLSFATDLKTMQEAMSRIHRAMTC